MASSSRKRETASSGTGADAHFLSDVIRTADIDCMNIEKRTKFIKAQLDSMSEDQLTRYCRYFGPMHYMLPVSDFLPFFWIIRTSYLCCQRTFGISEMSVLLISLNRKRC
jgi:hypothetical protein